MPAASAFLSFAHPLVLLALLPWAALTLYLLTSRRRIVIVPFLPLWPSSAGLSDRPRSWQRPPVALVAALAAALVAILAAAGPRRSALGTSRPVVIILDRGITMSARQGNVRRFQNLVDEASAAILARLGDGPTDLYVIPSGQRVNIERRDLATITFQIGPTAVDTQAVVADAVRALANPQAIVLLVSDQKINESNDRLVQIAPSGELQNVGVSEFSVRSSPTPSAMVRIRNDSPATQAALRVGSADPVSIALPPRGKAQNYFVDLPNAPNVIEATLTPGGDIDAADRAWAVRGQGWPALAESSPLPPELQRMVEVYTRERPPSEAGRTSITITSLANPALPNQIAVDVLSDDAGATTPAPSGAPQTQSHPITAGIDFSAALTQAQLAQAQPPAGFQPLVRAGDQTVVAIRDNPARQAWIGFRSTAWAATPDFVVFWTKLFDWLGQGDGEYRSVSPQSLAAGWQPLDSPLPLPQATGFAPNNGLWPGLYRRGNELLAVNAPPLAIAPAMTADWPSKLAAVAGGETASTGSLSPVLLIVALGTAVVAALCWPRRWGT